MAVARAVAAVKRHDDHRRRRFDRGGQQGGRRRQDDAHLDRRRRVAGVPRRPGAARRGGADGQVSHAPSLHRRQLEDVQDRPRGGRLREGIPEPREGHRRTWRSSSRRRSPPSTRRPRRRATRDVGVAAQNLHWEREGAFTGEVSGPMIKEAGAEYVIIGHSERRQLFGETDETVNRKIARRARRRPHADRLHRRDAGRARGRRDAVACSIARSRRASTASPASRSARS